MLNNRAILVLITVLMTATVLMRVSDSSARRASVFEQLDLLVDVRHELSTQYVEEPDQEKIIEGAVRGMIDSLDDPYTVYLSNKELEQFDRSVHGSFSGIGAEIDIFQNRLRIVSPLEESPAWQSGVMAGDIVLEIDGKTTEGIKITEAVERLTGEEGTDVTLKVLHESGEEKAITITRARINVQTVKGIRRGEDHHWDYMLDPEKRIGYLRLTQFTDSTPDNVAAALDQLKKNKARGLILDLRFNPGGLLEAAIAISDMFLKDGKKIVSVKGRAVRERVYKSTVQTKLPNIPVVVLANEASASASEIVTGALSDNDRALFVGTRTFGKGSVQQVKMLDSGQGAIKLTNAFYYVPSGRLIHRREDSETWGVDPADGCYVPMNTEAMRKMLERRREGDILRSDTSDEKRTTITPKWLREQLFDPQLAAGLEALHGKLAKDKWPKVGKSGADILVLAAKRDRLRRQRDLIRERLGEIEEDLATIEAGEDPDEKRAREKAADKKNADKPSKDEPTEKPAAKDKSPDGKAKPKKK